MFFLGIDKYKEFVEERIIARKKHFNETIKKSNIPRFPTKDNIVKKKSNSKFSCDRDEFKVLTKLLKVLKDRPKMTAENISSFQLSQYHALVDAKEKDLQPLIRSDKSSSLNDFMIKLVPHCVSGTRPISDVLILEGKELI